MTAVVPAPMVAAGMSALTVIVMVAADIGIVTKAARQQGIHRRIRFTADAAIESDAGRGQRHLGSAANAAANQGVYPSLHQEACQGTMAIAVGVDHFCAGDFIPRHLIDLELLRMAEVLEDLTVFISDCDFHIRFSFSFVIGFVICLYLAAAPAAQMLLSAADAIAAAGNVQRLSIYEASRNFAPRTLIDLLHGGAGDVHLFSALSVGPLL